MLSMLLQNITNLRAVSYIPNVGASIPVKHSEKHYLAQG